MKEVLNRWITSRNIKYLIKNNEKESYAWSKTALKNQDNSDNFEYANSKADKFRAEVNRLKQKLEEV